jgi:membrane protein DedA with SNARE-associated domain
VLTFVGCVPWVLMLGYIGQEVGARWESWKDSLHYFDYAVLAGLVIGAAYLLIRRRTSRGKDRPAPDATPS